MTVSAAELAGIACRRVVTPGLVLDNVLVEFREGRIAMIGEFDSSWLPPGVHNSRDEGLMVVPGFFDVHFHGCAGCDWLDANGESFRTILRTAAEGGATSVLATTTIPNDDEHLERLREQTRLLRALVGWDGGARVAGIHLEGPWLNPERRGGFSPRYISPIEPARVAAALDLCGPLLRKITFAPELPGAGELVRLVRERCGPQVALSIGHSAADEETARRAFDEWGATQVTHAFNALNVFHHRAPGVMGAGLADERVVMELIPDGLHVAPSVMNVLARLKGAKGLMLVTDASGSTHTPEGQFVQSVGGRTHIADGAIRLDDGALAGSNLLMNEAVAAAMRLADIPLERAVAMATLTPAQSVGLGAECGSLDTGKRADFAVVNGQWEVQATVVGGRLVYAR